ncbi:MAG TPA: VIT domain-containing protein [Planctomycetota bacterium]|nr:VIT domain-containing protein [Planctomycetota bacterium]
MRRALTRGGTLSWAVTCCAAVLIAALALVASWGSRAQAATAPAEQNVVGRLTADDAKDAEKRMAALTKDVTQGALRAVAASGDIVECPLRHTDVKAEVSGFIARVKVTQSFYNPLQEKIEAVYVFPLPHKSAVDDMTLVIAPRRIVGVIKRRAQARAIYEQALAQGVTAALLEQERPNIFTQSVGNIGPAQQIDVEISYVDVLEYDMGTYEFHFPMVVGPRFIPGTPTSVIPPVPEELKGKVGELDRAKVPEGPDEPKGTGWAPDTHRVPDASRITPPVLKPGFRNGHDITLAVQLDAGVPVQDMNVANHKAEIKRTGKTTAAVQLSPADAIPNKDFVLRYAVVGKKPELAVLAHTDKRGLGYFMLMIQPAEDERLKKTPPREIVFLVDVSGSMSGNPTAKVREAMLKLLKLTKRQDTFQVVTFANQSQKLFAKAVASTPENIDAALNFTQNIRGSGGTHMLEGIKMAINDPLDPERVRIVIMLTDGYIGNESEICEEVGRRCGDHIRFWCIGIGSSPNRHLIDGVARQGGGMSKVLGLNDDAEPLVQEVMFRIHRAQLAKVKIDWGGFRVFETYPAQIPELWAGRPVILFGLYENAAGQIPVTVSGLVEGQPASWPLVVGFPAKAEEHEVLEKVWARNKIEDLMHQTYYQGSPEVEEAVTQIALEYRLMSQYTSFVAVDEGRLGTMTEPARPPRRMLVPVPLPEGTRYEGFFGPGEGEYEMMVMGGAISLFKANGASYGARPAPGYAVSLSAPMGSVAAKPSGGPATLTPAPSTPRALAQTLMVREAPPLLRAGDKSARMAPVYRTLRRPGGGPQDALIRGRHYGGLEESKRLSYDLDDYEYNGKGLAWNALMSGSGNLPQQAQDVLKQGEELRKKGQLDAARNRLAYAYLLGAAVQSFGRNDGGVCDAALIAMDELADELVKSWSKEVPGLDRKLDLVIRDQSLIDALAEVSKAAGFTTKLVQGSLEDACAVTRRRELRVTYLDLRGATVAQAFDWMLRPLRMTWWVSGGSPVVATSRRAGVASPWVYDVSRIALPTSKELEEIKDGGKRIEAQKKWVEQFISAVRKALDVTDEDVQWFAPGELLVFGDDVVHASAARVFADLADAKARPAAALAALHEITSARAQSRKDGPEKLLAAAERARLHAAMRDYSWPLLAAACRGELDVEAATELQLAWSSPEVPELLKTTRSWVPLRSLWAISQAAKVLPDQPGLPELAEAARRMRSLWPIKDALKVDTVESELAVLAKQVRTAARTSADDALAALEKSPGDVSAYVRVLYAALASADDAELTAKALPLLTGEKAEASQLSDVRTVARALLVPVEKADGNALAELVRKGVRGDDMVVLTALACRRVGGDAWGAFRAEAKRLLGNQPLPGSVVVLINSLDRSRLPVVVAGR